jgi:hypothetical protein
MKRWEYDIAPRRTVLVAGNGEIIAGLDAYGADGWELVTIEPHPGKPDWDGFVFKRELCR